MYNHFNPGWASKRWGWSRNKSSFYFDASKATFTPRMAKRDTSAMGPFAAGVLVQGDLDGTGTPDVLSWGRGSQISGHFYANFDAYQFSAVKLWTPEKDRTAAQTNDEYLWYINANYWCRYEHDNARLVTSVGGQTHTDSLTTDAGVTYFTCVSGNTNNPADATNYIRISINDTHDFGASTKPTASAPDATNYLGSDGDEFPAQAILAGTTFYRRELWDGTYGVDAGNGDEIALIYAAGAGKKPEEVTGGDDIVFQLPTDGTPGELTSGTGEAWSWPSSSNELTNWHLQEDTAGAPDDWTAVNAPTLADAATADILFGTRSQKISVDAADEGIKQAFSVTAGDDYWLSALVKTGGAGQGVNVRVRDATGAADIVTLTTDATDYTSLTTCFEAPAGCSSVEVYIESTDADTYDIHAAQVQVLPNNIANGGMEGAYDDESGGGGSTVNVAPGWNSFGVETSGGDTLDESADSHSGSKSQSVIVDSSLEGIYSGAGISLTSGKWYSATYWMKANSGNVQFLMRTGTGGTVHHEKNIMSPVASWTHYSYVFLAAETTANARIIIRSLSAANFLVDDISLISLDDVSLTCTPASLANATETTGIRVGGRSTLTQPITGLTATRGSGRFTLTQRHDAVDVAKFGVATPYIVDYYGDATNYIHVYWSAANTVTLTFNDGGGVHTDTWDATGAVISDDPNNSRVDYNSAGMTLTVDGSVKITITTPIDFSTIPTTAYFGSKQDGTLQIDGTIAAP